MKKPARVFPNLQLKQARMRQGWSQEYVAQAVGTDAFTVSRWERGITMPSPHFRPKISALFGMSALELGLVPLATEETPLVPSSPQELFAYVQPAILDPAIPPLPAGEGGLVGRDELLRQLKQRLLGGKRQLALSALNGLPGVGKTALATALAHDADLQKHFSAGVLWAGLGRQPDVLGLLSRWGTLLGSAPLDVAQRSRPEAWAASIHATIGQRPFLLVIDDAWEMADALALQVGGPCCAHLITTRFPEIARRCALDNVTVVRELDDPDGRLLLMRLAPDAVQTEPQEAQALVKAVGGLPLALTLLGHYLRAHAHSQPRRIRAALERLRSADERLRLAEPQTLIGSHPSLEAGTQLSLQAVIGLSDQHISPDAQATLRALAIFPPKPNTFAEEAAVEISALPVEALDELTDAGLLESCGPARYTLHQTIADYAGASPREPGIARRLVTCFVAYVTAHAGDFAALDLESANILAALTTAYEEAMQVELLQGVNACAPFLITRGLYAVAETLLEQAQAAARALGDGQGEVMTLLHLGRIAEQRSHYTRAQSIWQTALELAREQGDVRSSAFALRELGELARIQGQPELAHQSLTAALEALTRAEDQQLRAGTLRILGNLLGEQGQPEQARQLYMEAVDISRRLGDQRELAPALANLGVLAREQGLHEQAREFYEEALGIFRALGDLNSASSVLMNLGNLARHQGQTGQAHLFYQEALALSRQGENRRVSTFILLNLASLTGDQGHFEQARQIFAEIIPIFQEFQDRRNLALVYQALGEVERDARHGGAAREHLDRALALFSELRDQRQIGLTRRMLGALAVQEGSYAEAHTLLNAALALLEQVGDQREVAQTLQEMGALARREGRLAEAHAFFSQALTTMRQLRDRRYAAHTLSEMGQLALLEGSHDEALRALLGAGVGMSLMHSCELPALQALLAQVRVNLGESAFLAGAARIARSTPELAYGVSQATWRASLERLLADKATSH